MPAHAAQDAPNTVYAGIIDEQAKIIRGRNQAYIARFLKSRITLKDGRYGNSSLRNESRTPLTVLMCATALVLLIAVANAANFLLARAAQRSKELAIRTALSAGKTEIMRQLLTEAMLLSAGGAIAGVLFAEWTLSLLISLISGPDTSRAFLSASLSWPVVLFGIAVSAISGVLFGVYPAWNAARTAVAESLKETGASVSARGAVRMRKALVCAQVALSVLLLIPTGQFLESLINLLRVDLGIRTENVISFRISPELNGYKPEQRRALFERIETALSAIPGVRSVAASRMQLLANDNWGTNVTVESYPRDPEIDTHSMINEVGPGLFSKMGIALIAGREFTDQDTLAGPKVAVVNEEFARYFFGDRNPVGRKFKRGGGNSPLDIEIVGVASNAKYSSVEQKTPRVFYTPWRQSNDAGSRSLYVRSALPPLQVIPAIRGVISTLDRDLPVEDLPHARTPGGAQYSVRSRRARDRRCVRNQRDGAGHARPVRRHGVQRDAAHARDRRSDGARRGPRPHPGVDFARGAFRPRRGRDHRNPRSARRRAPVGEPSVRRQTLGSPRDRRRRRRAQRGRACRRLHSDASRRCHQRARGVAIRMTSDSLIGGIERIDRPNP